MVFIGPAKASGSGHLINNILLQERDAVLYKDLLIVIIIRTGALTCSKRPIKTSNQRNSSISRRSALRKYQGFFFLSFLFFSNNNKTKSFQEQPQQKANVK